MEADVTSVVENSFYLIARVESVEFKIMLCMLVAAFRWFCWYDYLPW